MKFLGCLVFLLFGFVFIILAFFGNFIKLFYNMYKGNKQFKKMAEGARKAQYGPHQEKTDNRSNSASTHHQRKEGEKIFAKNEGEYVDFEDIKE